MNAEQIADKLVSWIMKKTLAAGCKGVVVGMSGGLDSSVVAVLCQRAFPQNVLGIIMPCHSSPEDKEHALAVAGKFSIKTEVVVLDHVFDALLKALPDGKAESGTGGLAQANVKGLNIWWLGQVTGASFPWATLPSMGMGGWISCPWAIWSKRRLGS